ncbi:MAG: hypothetical protein GKC04_06265, partial [Methanomicrobiales archaeon]|nr:hypothetical protein [Methanomicrobiales archaeon]
MVSDKRKDNRIRDKSINFYDKWQLEHFNAGESLSKYLESIDEALKPLQNLQVLLEPFEKIQEALKPFEKIQDALSSWETLFEQISTTSEKFIENARITIQEADEIMIKYKWIIAPSFFIGDSDL